MTQTAGSETERRRRDGMDEHDKDKQTSSLAIFLQRWSFQLKSKLLRCMKGSHNSEVQKNKFTSQQEHQLILVLTNKFKNFPQ